MTEPVTFRIDSFQSAEALWVSRNDLVNVLTYLLSQNDAILRNGTESLLDYAHSVKRVDIASSCKH